jgi:hypothetical protein
MATPRVIAGAVVDSSDAGGYGAKRVWLYATILTVGYMISRGLAKKPIPHHFRSVTSRVSTACLARMPRHLRGHTTGPVPAPQRRFDRAGPSPLRELPHNDAGNVLHPPAGAAP